jgi:hypothetical protein
MRLFPDTTLEESLFHGQDKDKKEILEPFE